MNLFLPEIEGSVGEDTQHRDSKALIESLDAVLLEDLGAAVEESIELPLIGGLSYIGAQSRSREIQGIYEDQAEAAGDSSGKQRHGKVFSPLVGGVHSLEEDDIERILGREIDGLGGEVSQHVRPVTSPEGQEAFLLGASHKAVHDSYIGGTVPVYGLSSNLGLFCWVCSSSLTLSMGAARVLAMAPEVPPSTKSFRTLFHPLLPLDELPPWCAIPKNQLNLYFSILMTDFQFITYLINLLTFSSWGGGRGGRGGANSIGNHQGTGLLSFCTGIQISQGLGCRKGYGYSPEGSYNYPHIIIQHLFFLQQENIIQMFGLFARKKKLDLQRTYIRIEFLTPEQRRQKRQIIQRLQKQYGNDEEQIIPYDGSFSTSFKLIMNTKTISPNIANSMLVNEFICHLEVTTNEQLAEFMHTYVKDIQLILHNNQMVSRSDEVPLYSEVDASIYRPKDVLEIIYEPKSLWERIKNRGKKMIKAIPMTCFSIVTKLLSLILGYFGLGGGVKSFIWRMMPATTIINGFISIVSIFFPFLGPLLTIGGKFIT